MRDKTASRAFRAKKKLDDLLEAALPGVYLLLYAMVTFTRIPNAECGVLGSRRIDCTAARGSGEQSEDCESSCPTRAASGPHRLRQSHHNHVDRHAVGVSFHRLS